jgi:hypothetical protein
MARPPALALTAGKGTLTLHQFVNDRGARVAAGAQAIPVLRQQVPVVAFVNNHFAGSAPETARQLVELTERPRLLLSS